MWSGSREQEEAEEDPRGLLMSRTEPLGLPRGSVRAILTIMLLLVLVLTLFVPTVPGADDVRSGLIALATLALRDYFGIRQTQNEQDGPPLPPPSVG
jgi:hypothetical protein